MKSMDISASDPMELRQASISSALHMVGTSNDNAMENSSISDLWWLVTSGSTSDLWLLVTSDVPINNLGNL